MTLHHGQGNPLDPIGNLERRQLQIRVAGLEARLLLLQVVADAAREVHTPHMTVTSMTAPPEFYDALWKIDEALRALDGAPGQGG
jgi:hypothetical protein